MVVGGGTVRERRGTVRGTHSLPATLPRARGDLLGGLAWFSRKGGWEEAPREGWAELYDAEM